MDSHEFERRLEFLLLALFENLGTLDFQDPGENQKLLNLTVPHKLHIFSSGSNVRNRLVETRKTC